MFAVELYPEIEFISSMGSGTSSTETNNKSLFAVDHCWSLLLEICHFTEDLNPAWSTGSLQNQMRKMSEALLNEALDLECQQRRFDFVKERFFGEIGFSLANEDTSPLSHYFLPSVLQKRRGPDSLLLLLFCALLEGCQFRFELSSTNNPAIIKIWLNDETYLINFSAGGSKLSRQELVQLINQGVDLSKSETNFQGLVIEYLKVIKAMAENYERHNILQVVHSYLMKYQPFNLKHISERAILAYRTGNYRQAVEDIRNYFHYKSADQANPTLRKIYKAALQAHRTH